MYPLVSHHPILKNVKSSLSSLPAPASLSMFWNLGSLLSMCLGIQLITGIFLATQYVGDINIAFISVDHLNREVVLGWLLRIAHANGARLFFICMYLHVARGIWVQSFTLGMTWNLGVLLLLSTIATAFLGYVLPWGQMSFWGTTVITSLFSAIPYLGEDIVIFLWGGFSVDTALTRFFTFHFLLPMIIAAIVVAHLMALHETGSTNPLGLSLHLDKIPFHPYYRFKDLIGGIVVIRVFFTGFLRFPWLLGDPENFLFANSLVTPVHIQPEWYFLFAYAILRAIPNKLGGVLALAISVIILWVIPFYPPHKYTNFNRFAKFFYWYFINWVLLLTWIGSRPVEEPYIQLGQILTVLYFRYFYIVPITPTLGKATHSN